MTITGTASYSIGSIARADFTEEELVEFPIDLKSLMVWDSATGAKLGAAVTDDMGYAAGTWAAASPHIDSITPAGVTIAAYARFPIVMPECYVAGGRALVRFHSRVEVQVSVSATLDLVAFESDNEVGIGSDLVTTPETSINAVTWADVDFELTPTGLAKGNVLDCRVHFAAEDGAANAGILNIGKIALRCHIKG